MLTTRLATVDDAASIAEQRRRMFVDSGQAESAAMDRMFTNFVDWVRPRLEDGRYLGRLVEEDGEADSSASLRNDKKVVGGAGMWLMDFPPHFLDPEPVRAYLLNFCVAPSARGRGLAETLLKITVDEAKRRGIQVVSLHASHMGRPIYERNGFAGTNEMILTDKGGEEGKGKREE